MTPATVPDRAARLAAAELEQDGRCFWCGRAFSGMVAPTTDHLVPRTKGGPSWPENEVAACRRCNGARGHTAPVDWARTCERNGWPTDLDALRRRLDRLEAAIGTRGGARRARPYVRGQLRRLR